MESSVLSKMFNQFNNLNIMVVGDVMVDNYIWGKMERISPEAPVPIVTSTQKESRLGGAANVGLNISSMGANPIMCSVIGKDSNANTFLDILEKRGMDKIGILQHPSRKTTSKTRIICGNHHVLRLDEEMDSYLDEEMEAAFIAKIEEVLHAKKIAAIVFQDYDKGIITPYIIEKITERANVLNIPTLVDPKKRNFDLYKNVTLFKPNFKELTEGLNVEVEKKDFESISAIARKMQREQNITYVFITLSELGVLINENGNFHAFPSQVRDLADVSGAGDTVISVAALCLAIGLSAPELAVISNLAGGLVCEKVGVVPVDKDKLLGACIRFYSKNKPS